MLSHTAACKQQQPQRCYCSCCTGGGCSDCGALRFKVSVAVEQPSHTSCCSCYCFAAGTAGAFATVATRTQAAGPHQQQHGLPGWKGGSSHPAQQQFQLHKRPSATAAKQFHCCCHSRASRPCSPAAVQKPTGSVVSCTAHSSCRRCCCRTCCCWWCPCAGQAAVAATAQHTSSSTVGGLHSSCVGRESVWRCCSSCSNECCGHTWLHHAGRFQAASSECVAATVYRSCAIGLLVNPLLLVLVLVLVLVLLVLVLLYGWSSACDVATSATTSPRLGLCIESVCSASRLAGLTDSLTAALPAVRLPSAPTCSLATRMSAAAQPAMRAGPAVGQGVAAVHAGSQHMLQHWQKCRQPSRLLTSDQARAAATTAMLLAAAAAVTTTMTAVVTDWLVSFTEVD